MHVTDSTTADIQQTLAAHKFPHANYTLIVGKLQKGEALPQDLSPEERYIHDEDDQGPAEASLKKLAVNQLHLKNAWESTSKSTRDDWLQWFRRFSVELLKESPQQALRACSPLTTEYPSIATDLFNVAFASCWTELYEQYQHELGETLGRALSAREVPTEILQQLLKLAEFMEHDDKPLPIDIRLLGMCASRCHAFAKALHYKETEYKSENGASAVEALISINNHLQQTDAAFGILRKAQGQHQVEMKESWFEKLQRWEDALQAYQKREREDPHNFEVVKGKMHCLHALGNWDVLSSLAQEKWLTASSENRKDIAPLAATAAWGMGQWDLMDTYLSVMRPKSPDHSFFGAIIRIHRNQFSEAAQYIAQARKGLEEELRTVLGESYMRAYSVVVRVQALAEMEEIIAYKKAGRDSSKREQMLKTWTDRLKGCQRKVEVWQRMLKVRALVITPRENEELYIKFASICRKSDRNGLAEKSLNSLIDSHGSLMNPENQAKISAAPYRVQYAIYKYMYANQHTQPALQKLQDFTMTLRADYENRAQALQRRSANNSIPLNAMNGLTAGNNRDQTPMVNRPITAKEQQTMSDWKVLLAKCYLKQGMWKAKDLDGDWLSGDVNVVLRSYKDATRYHSQWYKAWHEWALANFEVITAQTAGTTRGSAEMTVETINTYVVPAIQGFFKSIALSHTSSIQNTLRLLTLWFAYGKYPEVLGAITHGKNTVNINTWLDVIPQLIARITQEDEAVRNSVQDLLCEMGRSHPQALVYPLTVATDREDVDWKRAADKVMESMRQHSAQLCMQADMVSHELVRIGLLWQEEWHNAMESDDWQARDEHSFIPGIKRLRATHAKFLRPPETLHEVHFLQAHGAILTEAMAMINDFMSTGDIEGNPDVMRVRNIYCDLFKRCAYFQLQEHSLDLEYVSPRLHRATNLDLAVPGTYTSDMSKTIVRIQSFDSGIRIIKSKKRPRQLTIRGNDGVPYVFLLKGGEDIRQDERAMQLFGLVNTLLDKDPEGLKRRLRIQEYAAIPLGTNTGLLSWVQDTDTMHVLLKDYRDSRRIFFNIESRIMQQMAPAYDVLPLMQKIEVFSYALDNTTGQDLYRILWLKSTSSETWLDRRTTYTRSLAVMSIVGYILGLGDRHPSNLMIQRKTGKVVHIDFGDCFEVAMQRVRFPELVQFRLTRMLTFAMEVSGIEGSFRTTCEHVLRICKEHKESLIAVFEAFIHDPLVTWRLDRDGQPSGPAASELRNLTPAAMANAIEVGSVPVSRSRATFAPLAGAGSTRLENGTDRKPKKVGVESQKALECLDRVKVKLNGREYRSNEDHVDKLLIEATNVESLCQHYIGWCAFW